MSTNKTYLTIEGNLVADPEPRTTKNGATYASFRVAVTSRIYLREEGMFADAETSYYRVAAFNSLAVNILNSLKKGHPVVVHAAQSIREWVSDNGESRRDVQLTAEAVGHNLRMGRSEFIKVHRPLLDAVSDQEPALDVDPRESEEAASDQEAGPAYTVAS